MSQWDAKRLAEEIFRMGAHGRGLIKEQLEDLLDRALNEFHEQQQQRSKAKPSSLTDEQGGAVYGWTEEEWHEYVWLNETMNLPQRKIDNIILERAGRGIAEHNPLLKLLEKKRRDEQC